MLIRDPFNPSAEGEDPQPSETPKCWRSRRRVVHDSHDDCAGFNLPKCQAKKESGLLCGEPASETIRVKSVTYGGIVTADVEVAVCLRHKAASYQHAAAARQRSSRKAG